MSPRKILILAITLPTLGAVVYATKYSGKMCGGIAANLKQNQCPQLYECVMESNYPDASGVCRFMPNGLRFGPYKWQGNETTIVPVQKDPSVEYDAQTNKAKRLTLSQNRFGFELLKIMAFSDQTNSQNILISPVSINLPLAVLYNQAAGATKDQMTSVLQMQAFSKNTLNESMAILIQRLNLETAGVQTGMANSIWTKDSINLSTNYGVNVATLDFGDPQAFSTVNDWVTGNTAGKIKGAVSGALNPQTVSYIVSAAYFNGVWKYSFPTDQIEPRDFTKQDGSKTKIPSMKMKRSDFLYLENDVFQAVSLPYGKDQKYSMVVVMPKEPGFTKLLSSLSTDNWQAWFSAFAKREGVLYLPKFSLEYSTPITTSLKGTGLLLPFDSEKADFPELSPDKVNKRFYVNNVVHKTYLEVNEEGSETPVAVEEKPEVVKEPFVMEVNKPFMLAVVNQELQSNLFIGLVRGL